MPLTYRRDLNRPLSIEEMDDNFETLASSSFDVSSSLEGYLPLSGSTMTGDIVLDTDVNIAFIPKDGKGGTMTGGVEQTATGIELAAYTSDTNVKSVVSTGVSNAWIHSDDKDETPGTGWQHLDVGGGINGQVTLSVGNTTGGNTADLLLRTDTGEIEINSYTGIVTVKSLPIYADNATALGAGLVADNVYKTATGELRIVV